MRHPAKAAIQELVFLRSAWLLLCTAQYPCAFQGKNGSKSSWILRNLLLIYAAKACNWRQCPRRMRKLYAAQSNGGG
jgi:hypothetical protein